MKQKKSAVVILFLISVVLLISVSFILSRLNLNEKPANEIVSSKKYDGLKKGIKVSEMIDELIKFSNETNHADVYLVLKD